MSPLRVFDDCRERIKRACVRRDELKIAWKEFVEDDPYGYDINIKPDGAGAVLCRIKKAPPAEIALILGEMLYQLRASLDGAVFATAQECGVITARNERKFQFPVCIEADNWGSDLYAKKIAPLPDQFKRLIESVQPYHTSKSLRPIDRCRAIEILDRWAIIDRHRRLHVAGTRPKGLHMWITGYVTSAPKATHVGDILYDKCELATFRVRSRVAGVKREVKCCIRAAMALDESPKRTPADDGFLGWLNSMVAACRDVVDMLEGGFVKTP